MCFRRGAWKRRYCVLVQRTDTRTGAATASLQYYKGSKFGKLRGEIPLNDATPTVVRFLDVAEAKRPFCFQLRRGVFSMVCQATDDDDVSAWVCHLQSLIGGPTTKRHHHRPSSHDRHPHAAMGSNSNSNNSNALDDRGIRIVAELRRLLVLCIFLSVYLEYLFSRYNVVSF